jgi:ABC-type dipeptide/oligopeptide/nickel transport system ATPase subunit/CubicO group peptidase (beta-lactamase class C family)
LRFEHVTVRYGGRFGALTAVDDATLEVPSGQIVGLVGESGSGKSTLAKVAVGLAPLQAGRILLDGQPIHRRGRSRELQMVFQDPYSSLDPRRKVGDSIAEGLPKGADRRAEVTRLLGLVHLGADLAEAYPARLSGGQRQRVAIARALAGNPPVIIADEITSSLDVSIQGAILNLIRQLQRELGLSILFISHNLAVVRYVAGRIAVMRQGRIIEEGTTRQVLGAPQHPYTRQLLAAIPGRHGPSQHQIGANTRLEQHMTNLPAIDVAHWQERLDTLAQETGVPGAVLGILRLKDGEPDELVRLATGVLNVNTGRNVTVDSLFQIGSISKLWTATVVMQLVQEGKIALDQPVKEILPDFQLSTADLTDNTTVRNLLNHTNGLDGDVFIDTGRGDDNLAKFMDVLKDAVQIFPVGATWSYCNSGFSILGRIIEVVTGQVWDAAMRERLFAPLGLAHTVTLPEEALLFDTAVGHVTGSGEAKVAPVWTLQRNAGPAGLITADIADLLTFARMHLLEGVAADGTEVLRPETAQLMHEFSAEVPEKYLLGDSWGLGVIRFDWHGARLLGHDGNTIGQAAFLRIFPEGNLIVGLLTNESSSHELYQTLYGEVYAELCGVEIQEPLVLPEAPPTLDISNWLGTYERANVVIEIVAEDDGPVFHATVRGELAEIEENPEMKYPMVAVREGLYAVYLDDMRVHAPVWFYQIPSGERYVHFGGRATKKVS